jgi:hypothetical protein
MKDKTGNINDGFASKLKNYEAPEAPEVWEDIAIGVKRKMFYRFSWYYFNIYYLATIIFAATLITGLFITHKPNSPKEDKTSSDTIRSIVTGDSSSTSNKVQKPIKVTIFEKPIPNKHMTDSFENRITITPVNINNQPIATPQKDDDGILSKKDSSTTKEIKKPVVFIRKRDTIIDIDTIKTYKRKKRR